MPTPDLGDKEFMQRRKEANRKHRKLKRIMEIKTDSAKEAWQQKWTRNVVTMKTHTQKFIQSKMSRWEKASTVH